MVIGVAKETHSKISIEANTLYKSRLATNNAKDMISSLECVQKRTLLDERNDLV